MTVREPLGVLIGLIAGCAMSVAVSSVWVVLMIPARVQDRFQAGSPRLMTLAIGAGLTLSALHNGLGFSLHLPQGFGAAAMLGGGMFVGMLAAALGEILEVVPVLFGRFHLGSDTLCVRWIMLVGKGLGALLGCLLYTL